MPISSSQRYKISSGTRLGSKWTGSILLARESVEREELGAKNAKVWSYGHCSRKIVYALTILMILESIDKKPVMPYKSLRYIEPYTFSWQELPVRAFNPCEVIKARNISYDSPVFENVDEKHGTLFSSKNVLYLARISLRRRWNWEKIESQPDKYEPGV